MRVVIPPAPLRIDLGPLARELERRTGFAEVTLWAHKGVLVCRFVRHDGRRYDHAIGLHLLPDLAVNAVRRRLVVDLLLRRARAAVRRQERASDILRGLGGRLDPAR